MIGQSPRRPVGDPWLTAEQEDAAPGPDYCAMALDRETDEALADAFGDLRELKVNVAYPLLLELYRDYATKVALRGRG